MTGRIVPAAALLLFLFAPSLLSPVTANAAAEPVRLTVLFTNDVHGYVEPCG